MRGQMGRLIDLMHGRMMPRNAKDALHIAAFEGDDDRIRTLVESKRVAVDVRLSTVMGSSTEQTPLFLAIQEGNIASAKLLVELGAEIDAINNLGITPLMQAASHGDLKLLKLLLSLGANPNYVRTGDGATPLSFCMHADASDSKKSELALELIKAGADVDFPADRSQSVLMLAARENLPQTIEVLLHAGANPDRQCSLKWAKDWTALDHAINEHSSAAQDILSPITNLPVIATPGCVK